MARYFKIVIIIMFMSNGLFTYAQIANQSCHLLTINRSRDADIISYELNINDKGNIDLQNPIHIYWLRQTEQNQKEPLTWIQNKYAYGIKFIEGNNTQVDTNTNSVLKFQFVSYNKATLEVRKQFDNTYKIFTVFDTQEIEVSNIYIQFNGGTFWVPIITEVKINGIKPYSGDLISAVINP